MSTLHPMLAWSMVSLLLSQNVSRKVENSDGIAELCLYTQHRGIFTVYVIYSCRTSVVSVVGVVQYGVLASGYLVL